MVCNCFKIIFFKDCVYKELWFKKIVIYEIELLGLRKFLVMKFFIVDKLFFFICVIF